MTLASAALKNPYPGLRPFDVGEYECFFGRDRQVDEVLVRLRDHRFVAVVGLSGSGKSSLVRAGLIHKLEIGHLGSAGTKWRFALFRPGSRPVEALASALDDVLGVQPGRVERLKRSTQELLRSAREGRGPRENLLLVVDQFEEIFRFQRDQQLSSRDAAHFVDLLLAAEQDLSPDFPVFVVLTMRTDYLGDCAQFQGLPEVLNRCQYLVPSLTGDQMRAAIEGPAALTDTEVAPDLLQQLAVEAAEGRDRLPLLQHLLTRLWETREPSPPDGSLITAKQYAALGNPAQALNDQAEWVLSQLQPPERQVLARQIFQRLTDIGEGRDQRRPTRISELVELTGADPRDVTAVVEHFFSATFLTSPDRDHAEDWEVDITHESLIRQWRTLADWAKTEAADAEEYREFARRAARSEGGRSLLVGDDLDLAIRWLEKNHGARWASRYGGGFESTTAFIERSRKARDVQTAEAAERAAREAREEAERASAEQERARKERTRRFVAWMAAAATVVALVVGLLGVVAIVERRKADAQRLVAESESKKMVEQRDLAEGLRVVANQEMKKAKDQERLAAEQRKEAEDQRDLADRQGKETQRQRTIAIWQSLIREADRDLAEGNGERAALFTRQALRFHDSTPDQPTRLIEEMLFRFSEMTYFSDALKGHSDFVLTMAVSRDGKRLASGSNDGSIRLWDLGQPGFPSQILKGHTGPVRSVAFSADGTHLASGGADRVVRVWDLRRNASLTRSLITRTPTSIRLVQMEPVNSVAYSPDGTRVAVATDGNTLSLWDPAKTDAAVSTWRAHTSAILSVAFSPNGRLLASGGRDQRVYVWNPSQPGQSVATLNHGGQVSSIAFSPDGSRMASGSNDRSVRLWRVGEEIVQDQGLPGMARQPAPVNSVSFSEDGSTLAASGTDGTIRLWALGQPGVPPVILRGTNANAVLTVTFALNGTRLASGGRDNAIRLWDLQRGSRPSMLTAVGNDSDFEDAGPLAYSPDGTQIAFARGKSVRVWDPRQPSSVTIYEHEDQVQALAFSRDGSFATGGLDGKLRLAGRNRRQDREIGVEEEAIATLAFSPDGERLASGTENGKVRLWDLRQRGAVTQILDLAGLAVRAVAFSPDGAQLASAGEDKTIRLWNGTRSTTLGAAADEVDSLAFSPDGSRLAYGSYDAAVGLWSLSRPAAGAPTILKGHDDWVNAVAFSSDRRHLASASDDGTIRLWDLRNLAQPSAILTVRDGRVLSIAFSPDGTQLASSTESMVRVWDLWTRAADRICTMVRKNLSMQDWHTYIGEDIPYETTCPGKPPGDAR